MPAIKRFLTVICVYTFFLASSCPAAESPDSAATPTGRIEATEAEKVTAQPRPVISDMVVEAKSPENLAARSEGMKVYLTWDEVAGEKITYNIYRSVTPTADFMKINKDPVELNVYVDDRETSLVAPQSGDTYYYRVTYVDSSGTESSDSGVASARPFGPLSPPQDIVTSAGLNSVTLKWDAPESTGDFGLLEYRIYRSTEPPVFGMLVTRPAGTLEYEDRGLTTGAKYYYALESVDAAGNTSPMSAVVEAIPFDVTAAPKNVTVRSASSESIKISWDEPDRVGTFGISGYNVYRSTSAGSWPDKPVNEKVIRPYKDENGKYFYFDNIINSESKPLPGITYYYRVAPLDPKGNTGEASAAVSGAVPIVEVAKTGMITANISEYGLPPESKLTLTGKKSLNIGYIFTSYDDKERAAISQSSEPDIDQKLRLKLNGTIGKKINVDVNYDENTLTDEYTKISISYTGDKEETLQEVSFGDMMLDLPPTKYASFSMKLFGIKSKIKLGDKLTFLGLWATSKGITDIQNFEGRLRQKNTNGLPGVDIYDKDYIRNVYYFITKDPAAKVRAGSVVIYLDNATALDDSANTLYSTPNGNFHFEMLYPGSDYTVDYVENVIKFTKGISDSYKIAIGYELEDGTRVGLKSDGSMDFSESGLYSNQSGYTSSAAHLLQNGNTADISHKVVSYYYMGESQIYNPLLDSDFEIRIIDSSGNIRTMKASDANSSQYFEVDADFGILKFKGYFPFAKDHVLETSPYYNGTDGTQDDAYRVNSPVSLNTIHLNYKYYVSSYTLEHFPVVYGSERIYVDNQLKKRDVDYYIFYETGEINFIDKNLIQPTTQIKIVYEYQPFMQTFQSNLMGGRMDYRPLDNLRFGITTLYKSSSEGSSIPDARSTSTGLSTPYSSFVIDGDVAFDLSKKNVNDIINSLPLIDNADLPVDFRFAAETAYSDFNANIYKRSDENGVAMIDNMDGTDTVTSCGMSKNSWFPASLPFNMQPAGRAYMSREEVQEQGNAPVDPDAAFSVNTVTMMKVNYSNLTSSDWDSFRYKLSATGENMNLYNYIEMSVYVDTNNPIRLSVDVGVISEDSNGNGQFKYNVYDNGVLTRRDSEDVNINGTKNTGEDMGISRGIYGGSDEYWGKDNDYLDTEDMNANGSLDTDEAYYQFGAEYAYGSGKNHPEFELSGKRWVNIKIPLREYTRYSGNVDLNIDGKNYMSLIKHVRLTIKGAGSLPATGVIKIESIEFTGNSWRLQVLGAQDRAGNLITSSDPEKLNIETVSNTTVPSYIPNVDFYDYTTDSDKAYEESLLLTGNQSLFDQRADGVPIYYATKQLSTSGGYDYLPYKYIRADVFYRKKDLAGGPGRVLFLRLGSGSDDTQNYYQYNAVLDDIQQDGAWHTITFELDGSDDKRSEPNGRPNLGKVQYISLGFINPNNISASDEIYINNIRLTDPAEKKAFAKYVSSSMNIQGVGSVSHTYEEMDSDFTKFDEASMASIRQYTRTNQVNLSYNQVQWMPVAASYRKSDYYTEDKYKAIIDYQSYADRYEEAVTGSVGLSLIPDLQLNNAVSVVNRNSEYFGDMAYQSAKTNTMDITPSFIWKAPATLFIIPLGANTFEGSVRFQNVETDYYKPVTVYTDVYYDNWHTDRTQNIAWRGSYNIWNLTLAPQYVYTLYEQTGNLTSDYTYYQDRTEEHNRVPGYLVLSRFITPSLNITMRDAWIFSPQLNYSDEYRLDYTQNNINNTGKLEASTGLKLSSLWNLLPDISSYKFSINNISRFDNLKYGDSFRRYDDMTFERKWNLFMWQMLGNDDTEMRKYEEVAEYGVFTINHTLNLSEIKINTFVLGNFGFAPTMSYDLKRDFTSRGASRNFDERMSFSVWSFKFDKVNIPLPWIDQVVRDQTITGGYTYSRNIKRDAERNIISDTITNSLSNLNLSFGVKDGVTGSLGFSWSGSDSITGKVRTLSDQWTPGLNFAYNMLQQNPITIPGWIPFIGDKVFKFEQKVNFTLTNKLTIVQNRIIEPDLYEEGKFTTDYTSNAVQFDTALTGSYNVLQNLLVTVALEYSRKNDAKDDYNNSNTFKISVGGEIEF
ncbi:MAG: hypothetical protein LLG37_08415 [Spirochaetia bacterium]|nr:hypothetical protein [Spirochaetia bacterium]